MSKPKPRRWIPVIRLGKVLMVRADVKRTLARIAEADVQSRMVVTWGGTCEGSDTSGTKGAE